MKRLFIALLILTILLLLSVSALAQDDATAVPTDSDVPAETLEAVQTEEPTSELASATPLPTGTPLPTATDLPTLTPVPDFTPTPLPAIPPSQDVAIAGVNAFYAFIAGLGVGGLGFGAIILLAVTVILRSPVLLTAIEGLVYSRLDADGIKNLRGVGTIADKVGELIDKVTDGMPNDQQPQSVTITTTPGGVSPQG